jgi:hypothetical protein
LLRGFRDPGVDFNEKAEKLKAETGDRKLEVGGRRSEITNRKRKFRKQKAEI